MVLLRPAPWMRRAAAVGVACCGLLVAPALLARDEPQAASAASDSVLVLDVNPSSAGWAWMPLATLIRRMRSVDTVENRGYVLVGPD
jgi:hypothetical protein